MVEIYKRIEGYNNYQISNYGNVISNRCSKPKHLKGGPDKDGYLRVGLTNENGLKSFKIHILVAKHFIDNDNNTLVVDHIDGNILNNKYVNLRYVTVRSNSTICYRKDKETFSSLYPGVCWNKSSRKWNARIQINGKRIHIGYFINEINAHNAYQLKLKEYETENKVS